MRGLIRRHPGITLVALPGVAVLVVVGIFWSPATSQGGTGSTHVGLAPVAQNRPAPDVDLPLLSGDGSLRLHSLRGHVVVVNFWASWCTACKREVPAMESLSQHYRGSGVDFVGIDHGDKQSSAAAFAQRSGMSYASLVDDSGKALAAFGGVGLPATYVVDQTGRIRYQAIGTVDVPALERSVDLVHSGRSAPAVNSSAPPVQVTGVGGRPAPGFTLIDQFGRRTSLSDLRGHPVLLTFVDSRCEDVCQLTAEVLRQALDRLGSDAGRVRMLAVNANPRHFAVADVRAWSAKHGLLHRWRYVTGQPAQLRAIWQAYGVSSHYEHGELEHQAVVYVLDRNLGERSLLSMSSLRASVTGEADALVKALRPLLG